jgi:CHAT domain-containing protein
MKKQTLRQSFYGLVIIVILYLCVNIANLLWFVMQPTGLWGIYKYGGMLIVTLFVVLFLMVGVYHFVRNFRKVAHNIGFWILIVVFGILGLVIEYVPVVWLVHQVDNKYQYVNQTEDYFTEGKYEKALTYAATLYEKSRNEKAITSEFWILKKAIVSSQWGKQFLLRRHYRIEFNYAFCLENLGKDIEKVEQLYRQCLFIAQQMDSEQRTNVMDSKIRLAKIELSKGNVVKADEWFRNLNHEFQKMDERERVYSLILMLTYAQYAESRGDIVKGLQIREQAYEKMSTDDAYQETTMYFGVVLAMLNSKISSRNVTEARQFAEKANELSSTFEGDEIYTYYLNQMGLYEEFAGNYKEAETYFEEAIASSEEMPQRIMAIQKRALAAFYFRQKQYQKANEQYRIFWQTIKPSGYSIQENIQPAIQTALTYGALGNQAKAIQMMAEADSTLKMLMAQYFETTTLEEKEFFTRRFETDARIINAFYLQQNGAGNIGKVLNNVLCLKHGALQSQQAFEAVIKQLRDDNAEKLYRDIVKRKKESEIKAMLQVHQREQLRDLLDTLTMEEHRLIEKVEQHADTKAYLLKQITWQKVRDQLKDDEVAIEFVNFPIDPLNPIANRYYAVIVTPHSADLKLVPLGEEREIEALLGSCSKDNINALYSGNQLGQMFKMVWAPVTKYLQGASRVFVSLSGILHRVSFAALTIDESYSLETLSSLKEIWNTKEDSTQTLMNVALFGDVTFGTMAETAAWGNDVQKEITRNILSGRFAALPGTRKEISSIAQLMDKRGLKYNIYCGINATEANFRCLESDDKIRLIHIATHGFYYPKNTSTVMRESIYGISDGYTIVTNPMIRSGFLLSGELHGQDNRTQTDGVVTSAEISGMDLTHVDLVVLSACETGLGDISDSEGVYGLQRAFKMAGVKNIVMSLWQVPDEATSELMIHFYDGYLTGKSVTEALKEAQLKVKKKYPEPYYWAGFVVLR